MSNLFSYFQRIEPKKLAATTTDDQSISKADKTPQRDKNGTKKKSQTPKESTRKALNTSDIYSADSPKPEKRKQSPDTTGNHTDGVLPKKKSKTRLI